MAIYAFDGTNNEDNPIDSQDTNVLKFFNAYKDGYKGLGECFYVEGVGTRKGWLGKIFGGLGGAGGKKRIKEAMKCLKDNFQKGDKEINIIGFSRGAALALEFTNEISDSEINGQTSPAINFVGLWDTVASFGLPGNNINLGYNLTIPKNVLHCFHALALDERRILFPLTRICQNAYSDMESRDAQEVWFRGFHSDVGGGNNNESLSSISLVWMFMRARDVGIDIPENHLVKHRSLRDSHADCVKPKMDKIPNEKRTIFPTDIVHYSVSRRKFAAPHFEANNPPKGLEVTNDEGEILLKKFEE